MGTDIATGRAKESWEEAKRYKETKTSESKRMKRKDASPEPVQLQVPSEVRVWAEYGRTRAWAWRGRNRQRAGRAENEGRTVY